MFDFLIVVLCVLPVGGPFAAVLRLARALRVLRLVSALPKLQLLAGALLKSLSSMGYVSLLQPLLDDLHNFRREAFGYLCELLNRSP